MLPHQYTHIFVLGTIFAFCDAFGIGANDVANSFATSVSSGTLSLKQACLIAVFTEFLGALLLGSNTAETIRGGIVKLEYFNGRPDLLMLGMMTSIAGSAAWVIFATSQGWPISSTHSITGAVLGMGVAAFGKDAVTWKWPGVARIVTSWFTSPVIAAVVASILFLTTKYTVLRSENSFRRGLIAIPFYFFLAFFVNLLFIITNGTPGKGGGKLPFGKVAWISALASLGIAIYSYVFYSKWLERKILNNENLRWYHIPVIPFLGHRPMPEVVAGDVENQKAQEEGDLEIAEQGSAKKSIFKKAKDKLFHGVNKDVRNLNNEKLTDIHDRAEKYDDETERLFNFIQVLSACTASFAHGSNDVANAVGPYASIFEIWNNAEIPGAKSPVPIWVLAFGGFGIDCGLVLYGYHIMRALGNNITYTTPSRGFCAELGTSLTVVGASKLGLPVSTTHCITGAMAGVGLCNGDIHAVNWKMYAYCFFSWIMTLPAAGLLSGLFFALIAYSPEKVHV
ncbi:Phosphate-repressible phosphate permease pho-4 [Zancudomyces culisetae]|uniref:Phosphate transporter n=1 Tax=Zancudomyces culisetae TaxID=1213189 RepID=A0A1R1PHL3_ZANCU|nr:Phosphate-repressible phosphate permease pho-4 [Zancudomyces culisetae]|eukprot:OMH80403.1 Phosphate-repressible phosphate permease pho-4 [Zancudomyces culisetae]